MSSEAGGQQSRVTLAAARHQARSETWAPLLPRCRRYSCPAVPSELRPAVNNTSSSSVRELRGPDRSSRPCNALDCTSNSRSHSVLRACCLTSGEPAHVSTIWACSMGP